MHVVVDVIDDDGHVTVAVVQRVDVRAAVERAAAGGGGRRAQRRGRAVPAGAAAAPRARARLWQVGDTSNLPAPFIIDWRKETGRLGGKGEGFFPSLPFPRLLSLPSPPSPSI